MKVFNRGDLSGIVTSRPPISTLKTGESAGMMRIRRSPKKPRDSDVEIAIPVGFPGNENLVYARFIGPKTWQATPWPSGLKSRGGSVWLQSASR